MLLEQAVNKYAWNIPYKQLEGRLGKMCRIFTRIIWQHFMKSNARFQLYDRALWPIIRVKIRHVFSHRAFENSTYFSHGFLISRSMCITMSNFKTLNLICSHCCCTRSFTCPVVNPILLAGNKNRRTYVPSWSTVQVVNMYSNTAKYIDQKCLKPWTTTLYHFEKGVCELPTWTSIITTLDSQKNRRLALSMTCCV